MLKKLYSPKIIIMKPGLADQIAEQKNDLTQSLGQSSYGDFPEDHLVFPMLIKDKDEAKLMLKKIKKVYMIRNSITALENFLKTHKGEKLKDWLTTNKVFISQVIFNELGEHTNKNEGISGQLIKIQDIHDNEEEEFDKKEAMYVSTLGNPELSKMFEGLRNDRAAKRKMRREERKIRRSKFKKDGKGDLVIEKTPNFDEKQETEEVQAPSAENIVESPEKLNEARETPTENLSADAAQAAPPKEAPIEPKATKPAPVKSNKKVIVWGLVLTITFIGISIAAFSGGKKTE